MNTMTVYLGWHRTTEAVCEVERLGDIAGRVKCFECGGDGDWTKYHPEPELGPFPCVDCNGTGFVLVSI